MSPIAVTDPTRAQSVDAALGFDRGASQARSLSRPSTRPSEPGELAVTVAALPGQPPDLNDSNLNGVDSEVHQTEEQPSILETATTRYSDAGAACESQPAGVIVVIDNEWR